MMNQETGRKKSIDVTGYTCPYPAMFALEALKILPSGGALEVTIDDPSSVENIPKKAESNGYKVKKVEEIGKKLWKIKISK